MKYCIGEKAKVSKTISETDIYLFAGVSGDFNPAHVNTVEAEQSIFGKRIAHGILVGSLISNVIGMKLPGPGTIYMEQDMKFLKPVYIGDTVTAEVEVAEVINVSKHIIKLKTTVVNQNGDQVIDGFAVVKAPQKEEG